MLSAALFTACKSGGSEESETSNAVAEEASAINFDLSKTTLTWTAFKTPEKIGVPGHFDDIQLDGNTFVINANSVNTNNPDRDAKLKQFFFGNLSDSLITGSYGVVTNGMMPVTLKMNGIEKTFDFAVAEADSATVVTGTIDVISDFSGSKALEGINNACKELHQGKTWSDVTLQVIQMK